MQKRTRLRVGLIGCGRWGTNILRDLLALGAAVVVVDVDPAARGSALQIGATGVTETVADAFGVDGWIVATPALRHRSCIEAVAISGLPILCEKPLTTSLADADAIAASLSGPLHVVDVWRYHPAVERLRQCVVEGELGAVHGLRSTRANWTSPRVDVDTVWNLAPHEISIYLQVFETYPKPRWAQAECIDGQARSLWSSWGDQPWLISELSNRQPDRRRELRLHAQGGVAVFDGKHPDVLEFASGAADDRLEAVGRRRIPLPGPSALQRQLQHWLGFLAGGSAPRSDFAHARRVIAITAELRSLAGLPP